ncbi:MAG: hypothetical protein ACLSB9_19085 [Hydrogeniiclostridium mannosilyticum]
MVVLQKDKRAIQRLRGFWERRRSVCLGRAWLARYLALTKGAVTPLAVVNDPERAVEVLIDEDLAAPLPACPPRRQYRDRVAFLRRSGALYRGDGARCGLKI